MLLWGLALDRYLQSSLEFLLAATLSQCPSLGLRFTGYGEEGSG